MWRAGGGWVGGGSHICLKCQLTAERRVVDSVHGRIWLVKWRGSLPMVRWIVGAGREVNENKIFLTELHLCRFGSHWQSIYSAVKVWGCVVISYLKVCSVPTSINWMITDQISWRFKSNESLIESFTTFLFGKGQCKKNTCVVIWLKIYWDFLRCITHIPKLQMSHHHNFTVITAGTAVVAKKIWVVPAQACESWQVRADCVFLGGGP